MQQVHAKKFLGQHFLTDLTVARRIAETITPPQPSPQGREKVIRVIEVGPGMGVLTQYLLKNPDIQLTAIEIDRESVAYLREWYPELDLVEGDFLKIDLNKMIPKASLTSSAIIHTIYPARFSSKYWNTKTVFPCAQV